MYSVERVGSQVDAAGLPATKAVVQMNFEDIKGVAMNILVINFLNILLLFIFA